MDAARAGWGCGMTPERWQQLKRILDTVEESDIQEREDALCRACAGNESLLLEAQSLLAHESDIGAFERFDTRTVGEHVQERIGPYRIARLLGRGGMGVVYLAERADDVYRKQVAIKVIQSSDGRLMERFRTERQILARLEHPYIARLLDGGTLEDGRPYLVMEYVEGRRIDEYIAEAKLSLNGVLTLFLQVCEAVQFAHQNLIVHRDLKAGNILVDFEGRPRLLDFGIAKVVADEDGSERTQPFERILTPASASPEQVAGKTPTAATDVYSLSVLLYTLLTERSPYADAKNFVTAPAQVIATFDPAPASRVARDSNAAKQLKGDLDNILSKGLEKDPLRRYATVNEFAADLRNYLRCEPVRARPRSAWYRAAKFCRRNRVWVAAATMVIFAIIGGLTASLAYAHRAEVERVRAERRLDSLRTLNESLLFEFHDSIKDLPGATPARALVLKRALQYLDQLAADTDENAAVLADLASAYGRLAQIQSGERGPHLGGADSIRIAAVSNRKALAIWRKLALEHPQNEQYRDGLLQAMWSITDNERMDGDFAGAIRHQEERLAMVRNLYAHQPSTKLQYSISASLAALSDLHRTSGNADLAVNYAQKALAVRQAILNADPGSFRAKRAVALSHEFLGHALSGKHDYARAAEEHKKTLELVEPLVPERRNDGDIRRLQFVAKNNLCESLSLANRPADALPSCRSAVSIEEALHRTDTYDLDVSEDLASAYSTLGSALQAAGRYREARGWQLRAELLSRTGMERDPDSSEIVLVYLDTILSLAEVNGHLHGQSCEYAVEAERVLRASQHRWPENTAFGDRAVRLRRIEVSCGQ